MFGGWILSVADQTIDGWRLKAWISVECNTESILVVLMVGTPTHGVEKDVIARYILVPSKR
jgi:hypothetical protein